MKITIRLRPDRDDDIRDWYQSLARGDRSRVIRDILKEFIDHKKGVGKDYFELVRNYSMESNQIDVNLKTDNTFIKSNESIDSKLDDLLDQI